ncbi:MAG: histidinol-phosphate transaminase [Paracoccaceae bacterium]
MTAVQPRPGLLNIREHMIGAPAAAAPPAIHIGSNECAFGASPRAYAAATAAVRDFSRYPEGGPEHLAAAIGKAWKLDPDRIACGNGSDDLLARLARAFLRPGDELICSINGYQKFPNYAHANDAIPVAVADNDFMADVDAILAAVTPRTRIVMIANPDNPTGSLLKASEVRRLHAGLPGNVVLVLDSAYAEFATSADFEMPDRLVEEFDNIVMTRTFSKVYGLAGARVGWIYGPPTVIDAVKRIGITFPLSGASLAAACAAVEDEAHMRHVIAETLRLRKAFSGKLSALRLKVYPSETNFVLVRFPDPARAAVAADRFLLSKGIMARRFGAPNFTDFVRFTIGLEGEMTTTADVLAEFLAMEGVA